MKQHSIVTAKMKKHFILTAVLSVFLIGILSCFVTTGKSVESKGYNFSEPDVSWSLPDTLREISGLTVLNEEEIGCVQDENGILFIYNMESEEIVKQIEFGADGDYEGITHVGNTMYILRSDGVLFEISDYTSDELKVDSIVTQIPAANNEGLCYDEMNNRLLIACKVANSKDFSVKSKRMIYGIDLKTKKTLTDPVYAIDIADLKAFASKHQLNLPVRISKKNAVPEPIVKFRPSAISIHPVTKKLYMLSASDHLLLVFDRNGKIERMEVLDEELFNKAEGISFMPNGDLLISNEGQEKKPSLLRFKH